MKKRRSYNRKQAYIDKYGPAGAKEILKLQGKNASHYRWHRGRSC